MKENLRVKIPKRFKEQLERHFDLRRAKKEVMTWIIHAECPLCSRYTEMCEGCPLKRFKDECGEMGCTAWVKKILGKEPCFQIESEEVWWRDSLNKKARKGIKEFKKRARRLIEWV